MRPTPAKRIRRMETMIALAYWVAVLVVFFYLKFSGFDMAGEGGIPMATLTVPWSLLVIRAAGSASSPQSQAFVHSFESSLGTFVLSVFCGGLNAVLIFALVAAIRRRWNRHIER